MTVYEFMNAIYYPDVDLWMVRCVQSSGHASLSLEEVDASGHQLAELSDMLSKRELLVVPDTQENQEIISKHLFSVIGDVWLPGRFCTIQAGEGHLALGCVEGQSRVSRPSNHLVYFCL